MSEVTNSRLIKMVCGVTFSVALFASLLTSCSNEAGTVRTNNRSQGSAGMYRETNHNVPIKSSAPDGSFGLTETGGAANLLIVDLAESFVFGKIKPPAPCFAALPNDFVIGYATCAADASKTVTLTAANVRQICSATEHSASIEPALPIAGLNGCRSANIIVKGYNPPLTVTMGKK